MSVNMAGALPSGDSNGLGRILSALVNHPEDLHVGIVLFDVVKLTTAVDTNDITPTVRIRAIEPIPPGEDAREMHRLLRRAFEDRTGKVQLPLDLERELDDLGSDRFTGEIPEPPPSAPSSDGDDAGWDDQR